MYSPVRIAALARLQRRLLLVALMWVGGVGAAAAQQQSTLLVGTFLERNYSIQPGVQVSYASPVFAGGKPRLSASYSTTRLATTLGSNGLVEDRVQAGAGWYFRPARTISPYTGLNIGYTRFDLEDRELFELLDNNAAIVSLLVGAEAKLRPAIRVNGNLGYSALQSSTVYPFVASIGVHYHLKRGSR